MRFTQEQNEKIKEQLSIVASDLLSAPIKDEWTYSESDDSFTFGFSARNELVRTELIQELTDTFGAHPPIASKFTQEPPQPMRSGTFTIRAEDINIASLEEMVDEIADRTPVHTSSSTLRPITQEDLPLLDELPFAKHFPPSVTNGKWHIPEGGCVARLVLKFPYVGHAPAVEELVGEKDKLHNSYILQEILNFAGRDERRRNPALYFQLREADGQHYWNMNAYYLEITDIDPAHLPERIKRLDAALEAYGKEVQERMEAALPKNVPDDDFLDAAMKRLNAIREKDGKKGR